MANSISATGTTAGAPSTTKTTTKTAEERAEMTQNQFLKLLVTKLAHQDPLNIESQEDFLGQLAQFESLNQSIKLNKNMESLSLSQSLSQSSALLGKTVEYENMAGMMEEGEVSAIRVVDGKSMLVVNDEQIEMSSIKGVK